MSHNYVVYKVLLWKLHTVCCSILRLAVIHLRAISSYLQGAGLKINPIGHIHLAVISAVKFINVDLLMHLHVMIAAILFCQQMDRVLAFALQKRGIAEGVDKGLAFNEGLN